MLFLSKLKSGLTVWISKVWSLTLGFFPLWRAAVVTQNKELTVHLPCTCHCTTELHCGAHSHAFMHAHACPRKKKVNSQIITTAFGHDTKKNSATLKGKTNLKVGVHAVVVKNSKRGKLCSGFWHEPMRLSCRWTVEHKKYASILEREG